MTAKTACMVHVTMDKSKIRSCRQLAAFSVITTPTFGLNKHSTS